MEAPRSSTTSAPTPEPWGELAVLRVVAEGDEAAAEIAVTGGQGNWRLAAFWTARDGRLHHGVECWTPLVGDGDWPARRATSSSASRAATKPNAK